MRGTGRLSCAPVAAAPYAAVARALLVEYGLNTIMPARLGELFRAEFFNCTIGVSRVWALTSIVIERLFDGVTVVLCLGLGSFLTTTVSHNAELLGNVLITGSIIFGATLAVALGPSGSAMTRAFSRFPAFSAKVNRVRSGFKILRSWGPWTSRRSHSSYICQILSRCGLLLRPWCRPGCGWN